MHCFPGRLSRELDLTQNTRYLNGCSNVPAVGEPATPQPQPHGELLCCRSRAAAWDTCRVSTQVRCCGSADSRSWWVSSAGLHALSYQTLWASSLRERSLCTPNSCIRDGQFLHYDLESANASSRRWQKVNSYWTEIIKASFCRSSMPQFLDLKTTQFRFG